MMNTTSYFRFSFNLILCLCCRTLIQAQPDCNMPASIIQGVECPLVYDGGLLLLPCSAPIGFYSLPIGTQLMIAFVPENCITFCQQGLGANLQCAQVVGGENVGLCAGQSVSLGAPALPNRQYQWSPVTNISCDTCAIATVNPPGNAIYTRTETVTGCAACPPETTYYNVSVSPCSGLEEIAETEVVISPVPATGALSVTGMHFTRFRVFDTQGKLWLQGPGNAGQTIDVAQLPAGMYYLRLSSPGLEVVRKIVKEN